MRKLIIFFISFQLLFSLKAQTVLAPLNKVSEISFETEARNIFLSKVKNQEYQPLLSSKHLVLKNIAAKNQYFVFLLTKEDNVIAFEINRKKNTCVEKAIWSYTKSAEIDFNSENIINSIPDKIKNNFANLIHSLNSASIVFLEKKQAINSLEVRLMNGLTTKNQKADEIIKTFLDKLKEMVRTDQGVETIRKYLYKKYVIKKKNIPESHFELQKIIAKEQGYGEIQITDAKRKELTEVIFADQKSTLDLWLNYFLSEDSESYPLWAKYWAFKSMLQLAKYDKEKGEFSKRNKTTTAPFPDLDMEALSYVIGLILNKTKGEIQKFDDDLLNKFLANEDFGKLYAYAIEKVTPATKNNLENTAGKWVKYDQGSDHLPLVASLQGHGTGWCTAGESTAKHQLASGDFYVYYSNDINGKATIPRVAIRMQGTQIAEVRGVAENQNLDPFINKVVDEKLKEFPDGQAYKKKTADMKKLTEIYKKQNQGSALTKEELTFLYEIENNIEGFGYQIDPRIEEIKLQRNLKDDYAKIYDIDVSQIADNLSEIGATTKVYLGKEKFTADEYTTEKEIQTLSEIIGLTTDITSLNQQVKDIITTWNGSLVSEEIDLSLPSLKRIKGDLLLNKSKHIRLPLLETVGKNLEINSTENIELPMLKKVGEDFHGFSARDISLPVLEVVGKSVFLQHTKIFAMPNLQTVGENLIATFSKNIATPKLKIVGKEFDADRAEILSAPVLEKVGTNFTATHLSSLDLPMLKFVGGSLKANFIGSITASISLPMLNIIGSNLDIGLLNSPIDLPSLKSIGGYFFAQENKIVLPKLETIGGIFTAHKVKDIDLSSLQKAGGFDFYAIQDISLPLLENVSGDFNLPYATKLDSPMLEKVGGDFLPLSVKNVSLPLLKIVNGDFVLSGDESVFLPLLHIVKGSFKSNSKFIKLPELYKIGKYLDLENAKEIYLERLYEVNGEIKAGQALTVFMPALHSLKKYIDVSKAISLNLSSLKDIGYRVEIMLSASYNYEHKPDNLLIIRSAA